MSLKQILLVLEDITGLKAPTSQLPYWIAYVAGWTCEVISNFITHRAPPVPLGGVKMARYKMYFDPAKAIRELGLPQTSIESALQESVDWFMTHHYASVK